MNKKKKLYEEGSLFHYAALSLDKIRKLSKSDVISEKLLGLNILLFILLTSLFITHLFVPNASILSLEFFMFFAFSLLISFIVGAVYANILEILANVARNRVGPLRLSVIILSVDLPIALAGTSFHVPLLISIAFGILMFQLFVILFGALVDFPALGSNDQRVKSNRLRIILGDVGSIASIISLVVAVIMIMLGK